MEKEYREKIKEEVTKFFNDTPRYRRVEEWVDFIAKREWEIIDNLTN